MKINYFPQKLKPRLTRHRRGSILLEAVAALVLLTVAGLILLKGSLNVLAPRQWSLVQNITDSHMTFEKAYAERIPFAELTASDSPWPAYPTKDSSAVVFGTLPGGRNISGTVIRTRFPDSNNLPAYGGTGTLTTNPAEMQVWKLQTLVLYKIAGRDYVKNRTIIRSQ